MQHDNLNLQDDQDEFDEGIAQMTPKERSVAIQAVVDHGSSEQESLRNVPEPEILRQDVRAKGSLSDLLPI